MKRLVEQGERVTIVTACTADWPADRALTPAIHREHDQWQLGDWPYRARRLEDAAATYVLGATALHLNLPDAIYRFNAQGQLLYVRDFMGIAPHPDDWKVQAIALAAQLTQTILIEGAHIYCPLAVGRHVDHTIVRQVTEVIFPPERITYYEDYPYADQPAALLQETSQLKHANSINIQLSPAELVVRIEAISCYHSQVRVMFGNNTQMAERLRAYVGNLLIERYWKAN